MMMTIQPELQALGAHAEVLQSSFRTTGGDTDMRALTSTNRTSSTSAVVGRRLNVIDRCREQATRTLASANSWTIRSQDSKEYKMSIADIGLTPDRTFMAVLPSIRMQQPEVDVKSARLKLLLELTNSVASRLELGDLLKKVSMGARRVVTSDFGFAGLVDSRTGRLNSNAFDSSADEPLAEAASTLLGEVLAEQVFTTGKPWVGKAEELAGTDPAEDSKCVAHGFSNVCALPLTGRDHVLGVLAVCKREDTAYAQD